MQSNQSTNEAGYDEWSAFYDQYPNPTVAIDELTFPDYCHELQHQRVLEIGCGTGRHTVRLLQAGNLVTGIDISGGMLARLREKIQTPALALIQGDFLTAEIPGGPFDAIVAALVLEHIADLEAFFRRARACLRPGGRIYLSEIHPARTAEGIFAHFRTEKGTEVQLESHAHTESSLVVAAAKSGVRLRISASACGIRELTEIRPEWSRHFGKPMLQIWVLELESLEASGNESARLLAGD